jgi:ribosomal-protein-alanine N-acetyltransferase
MIIETERLILRDYEKEDIDSFYKLKSCNEVWIYSTCEPLVNKSQAQELLNKVISNRKSGNLDFMALFRKDDMCFIGEAGIIGSRPRANRCELGYNLLPDYWGNGYAAEIVKGIIKYAYEENEYERIEALVLEVNNASCRVLEKSGFTKEGVLRNFNKYKEGYRNVIYYGMISDDYYNK